MNKKLLIAGSLTVLILAGCQNLTEQITKKVAEGVINASTNGEVKVNMDDLQKGKITVTTKEGTINMTGNEQGGKVTMTDKDGKTLINASGDENSVTVTDEKGGATFQSESGEQRPASVPAELPSLPNGYDFGFFTVNELGSLSFSVKSTDLKAVCDQEALLVEAAGWQNDSDAFSGESSESVFKNYLKGDLAMTLTCVKNDSYITVALMETKKPSN